MELAEVVNPHFAVPVVGVVLCAVLVFAFGFKSPAQPPSFDFDDHEDRKNKRQKKGKQKTPSNGHVVNVDSQVPPVSKQSSNPKQSPKVIVEKSEPPAKLKVKKVGITPKPSLKPASSPEVSLPKEEDGGGWTVAVTRKDKKRGKKDEAPIPAKVESKKEESVLAATEPNVAEVVAKTPEPTSAEPPKPPRNKKERKPKETPAMGEKVETIPGDQSDKENTPEIDVIQQEAPIPAPIDTADKSTKASPKKKKNKKGKPATEQEINKETSEVEPALGGAAQTPAEETKNAPVETSDIPEMPEKPDTSKLATASANTALTETNSKPARSPKKKKKNKSPEPNVSEPAGAVSVPDPSASVTSASLLGQGAKTSAESSSHSTSKGAAKDRVSEPVSDAIPAPSSAASPQIAKQEDKESTEKVSFDELGEWQEAKPVKKKKKARRDN